MRDFAFYVQGIEDATVAALRSEAGVRYPVSLYDNELEGEADLRTLIAKIAPRLPHTFVTYAGGRSLLEAPVAGLPGRPEAFNHTCTINVICCTNDRRGGQARRRGLDGSPGIFSMIADAHRALLNRSLATTIGDERIALTSAPLRPRATEDDVQITADLPGLTAALLKFDTAFKIISEDRADEGGWYVCEELYVHQEGYGMDKATGRPAVHVVPAPLRMA